MSRGMTLLEVVLALALLSGVAIAAASWTSLTARAADQLADESSWSLAAANTLGLIGDAVASGDPIHDREPVRCDGSTLTIRTRDAVGPAILDISLDREDLVLRRTTPGEHDIAETVLLDRIAGFDAVLDDAADRRILTVVVHRDDGAALQRAWELR